MMNHPFISGKNLYFYCGVWFLIAIIQSAVLFFVFGADKENALTDGLVYSSVFAIIAIALWFSVLYTDIEQSGLLQIALIHFLIATFSVGSWLFAADFIIQEISPAYHALIAKSPFHYMLRAIEGIFYYLVISLIYYLVIYFRRYQDKKYSESELKSKIHEAELSMLKSQINPHFLFNSLNSVNSLTITDAEKARQMLVKLSDFMRYALSHGDKQQINLSQEVLNMERYLEIEKIRFGNKLQFLKNIHENARNAILPALILQPLIENAIKHGVYETTETITIKLDCMLTTNGLQLILGNNFDPDAIPRKGAGIGLKNIASRLELIFKRTDLIQIKKTENYFEVSLLIPQPE